MTGRRSRPAADRSPRAVRGLAVGLALASACAPQVTTITTSPPGAVIQIDGRDVCATTPCAWTAGPAMLTTHRLEAKLAGHETASVEVATGPGKTSVLWTIGAGVIGLSTGTLWLLPVGATVGFGLAVPPGAVHVVLRPRAVPTPPAPSPGPVAAPAPPAAPIVEVGTSVTTTTSTPTDSAPP